MEVQEGKWRLIPSFHGKCKVLNKRQRAMLQKIFLSIFELGECKFTPSRCKIAPTRCNKYDHSKLSILIIKLIYIHKLYISLTYLDRLYGQPRSTGNSNFNSCPTDNMCVMVLWNDT